MRLCKYLYNLVFFRNKNNGQVTNKMSRKRTQQVTGNCIYEAKCKVCNSKVKNIIENLKLLLNGRIKNIDI